MNLKREKINEAIRQLWLLFADVPMDELNGEDADVFYEIARHPAVQEIIKGYNKG